ncbi:restriction endonuclease subunit S, partial [Acetobacter sp.]|uniref:restriction endonuclease subunit S n=1 Tax=Acetobacter sp. TaxID=440 RepID=UPI0039EA3EF7
YFAKSELISLSIRAGDILVCEGGDVGRSTIIKEDLKEIGFQNSLNRVRGHNNNSTFYFSYFLNFVKKSGYLDIICNKSTISHYTREKLCHTPFLYPPILEQNAIATFLDSECAKIDSLINHANQNASLLKERRSALISAAVTGKIDVRTLVKPKDIAA